MQKNNLHFSVTASTNISLSSPKCIEEEKVQGVSNKKGVRNGKKWVCNCQISYTSLHNLTKKKNLTNFSDLHHLTYLIH